VHLRGQENVYKRVLIHLGGFNLSLVMRQWSGKGTPRGWQGFSADALLLGLQFWIAILLRAAQPSPSRQCSDPPRSCASPLLFGSRRSDKLLTPRTARFPMDSPSRSTTEAIV